MAGVADRMERGGWRGALCTALLALWPLAATAGDGAGPPRLSGVEACQQDHALDLDRHVADLALAGWQPVPGDGREAALGALADAFLPLFGDEDRPADYREMPEETVARRAATREWWQERAQGHRLLVQGEDVLFIDGARSQEGHRSVECWVATGNAALVEGLIGRAETEGPEAIGPEDSAIAVFGPGTLESGAEFTLVVSRQIAPPGLELAGTHGFLTVTVFPPVE